jgi:nitrite reductase/ring-hydroxylating ferredoxin subunit
MAHMRKSLVELSSCAKNASSSEDRVPYTISRRGFLGGSAAVVLPVLCGGCAATPGPPIVPLPAVANKQIAISLGSFPDLMRVGGWIVGRASGYADPIVIAQVDQGMFAAFNAICTHMNCTVSYNALNLTLDCPCHGSTYDAADGTVLGGPAPLPLKKLVVSSDSTTVTVTLP